ncbi:uncharacterized protein LOC144922372 [Branchiostoma floridae x Branchiostoma belcheri]
MMYYLLGLLAATALLQETVSYHEDNPGKGTFLATGREVVKTFPKEFLKHCVRQRNASVYCSRSGLSSVPRGTPKTTRFLHLSRNNFQAIGPHTFPPLPVLEYLDLSWNNLYSIQNHTFYNINHLKILYLNNTLLQTIQNGAFADLQNLEVLGLAGTRVSDLSNPGFLTANLKHLRSLSFANSSIKVCKLGKAFRNLMALRHLDLRKNLISQLSRDSFASLAGSPLETLDLSFNRIAIIGEPAFWPFQNITNILLTGNKLTVGRLNTTLENLGKIKTSGFSLALGSCSLHSLSSDTFKPLANIPVMMLDLSNNKIQKLQSKGMFRYLPKLETLLMHNNNITSLKGEEFTGLGNLKTLNMSGNELPTIVNGSFSTLGNLTSLYVTLEARRSVIERGVFSDMPYLRTLYISGPPEEFAIREFAKNSLAGLLYLEKLIVKWHDLNKVPTTALRSVRSTLRVLILQYGSINKISPNSFHGFPLLKHLKLSNNRLNSLPPYGFAGLHNLTFLTVNDNFITKIHSEAFYGLPSLRVLELNKNRLCLKASQPLLPPFTSLSNLVSLNLGGQSYQCYKIHGINSFPKDYFKGLVNLKKLDLQHNNLRMMLYSEETSNPFENLTSLTTLNIRHNEFHNMSPAPFKNLSHLEALDLSQNRLSVIPIAVYKQWRNLRKLFLQLNQLQMVTEKGLGLLKNLQDLNLEYNTLNCACNLEWLIKWVSENQTQVVFHNLANYFCAYPRSDRRITILNYDPEAEKCHSQLRYYAAILSSVFILVYMMAIFVMYRNRYYIEYGWYLLRSKAKVRPKAPLGKRKIYHAFISYNGRDSKWVTRRLVPKLEQEEPRLKLCIHERDFTGGVSIVENIITNIQKSRKVVCLVTRNFLKSGWCREEFHLAQMGLFEDGNDVLILVLLDNIPEHYLSTYVRLRKLMCRKTYIEWPTDPKEEPLFWRRLREALETSNVPKQQRRTAAYGAIVMEDEELESLL